MLLQKVLRLALWIFAATLVLTAQTGSGTVEGVVRDATSAVIARAGVTILNTATGVKSSTKSNEVGFFAFPPVVPGSYEIKVELAGMQTWESKFLLQVGQTVEISPILRVGAVTTQISVAEGAPLVPTTDATLSENLERTRIEQLPLDFGRTEGRRHLQRGVLRVVGANFRVEQIPLPQQFFHLFFDLRQFIGLLAVER